ncbi:rhomboid family intramembrane serine protease [Moritella sp.]|uniref:rhomboid family intramembrane serine protease n=1 Tax=Moritella sp. TaxID=78556 RepID=UPI001D487E61|nr:rhomboid family intramembrane serine protease [Moritella sp.]MCJ8349056.1 rhomboid family intramembrane serine protease [Moritella sp.]NQZ41431.1 rhomboid family intramembrane serine protease [Moritella sp.]
MIIFLITVAVYVGLLIIIKPAPSSLKAVPITYSQNLKLVWASICSGVLILLIFLLTTNFSFIIVDENVFRTLALSNDVDQFLNWPLQSITHLFIHGNLVHLAANVVGLGLASAYERRVGAKRYFAVLLVGGLASIPSIFVYSENIAVCGLSGGIFGLAAAYFTDEEELTTKEWILAISLFLFLAIMMGLDSELKSSSNEALDMRIDHFGHLFGALGTILYCRLKPLHLARASTGKIKALASPPN